MADTELTGKIEEESATGYDQVDHQATQETSNSTGATFNKSEGRTDRNYSSTGKTTVRAAHKISIGFEISFSVPLDAAGLFPTKPGSC